MDKDENKNNLEEQIKSLKEKFLEYCNENQRTENYQTQLLQLYADKLFKLAGHEKKPEKLEGEIGRYYNLFMEIIQSEDSVYNKKTILDYINNSWLFKPRIYLYKQKKKNHLKI